MKKKLTPSKNKAWKAFSKYIRLRDCLKYTGDSENGVCVTCKRSYPFSKLQAGHFIAGRNNAILFDEEAVHSQCYGCNVGRSGAHVDYFIFMEREYGRDKIEELRAKRHLTVKFTVEDYEATERYYKQKYIKLLTEHNKSVIMQA